MEIETALDIITEDYDDADYEVIEDMVDDGHVKHDTTAYYSIVLRKSDNTYWKISYHTSYNYGFDDHSVDVSQVEKAEVVQTIWKAVK